jgi:hypothetical protein
VQDLVDLLNEYKLHPVIVDFNRENILKACSIEVALKHAGDSRNVLFANSSLITLTL